MAKDKDKKNGFNKDRPLVPVNTAIDAFIASGYRSTAAAVSEIIDNSIEAHAKNIEIIVFDKLNDRGIKKITKIAIVDDGTGMDNEVLATSLQFGNGSKLNSRKGLGRFGIGLPNSSSEHNASHNAGGGLRFKFRLLLSQIICRRLKIDKGIVRIGSRINLRPTEILPLFKICFINPLPVLFFWGNKALLMRI